jgi:hypothetical protein
MVKAIWFKSYDAPNEQPDKFDHIVQSWDTANKASVTSDFSVCTSCGIKRRDPLPVARAALPALRPRSDSLCRSLLYRRA